jgi:hypothetical protein
VKLYLHSLNTPSWRGAQSKHRDNIIFTFIFYISLSTLFSDTMKIYSSLQTHTKQQEEPG